MALSAPPPPPLQPSRPPVPAQIRALVGAVAVLLAVSVVAVAVRGIDGGSSDHPDEWDPRVAALADYVADARGLRFDHPVEVQFLTPEEYREVTSVEEPTGAAEEVAEELEGQVARLRALGVVTGDLDLAEVLEQTVDASTLAFYSPQDDTIRVRGTDLTVGLRVTLVHELTHALQDQHFDLDGLLYAEDLDDGEADAALGLIEGDATRIEELYIGEVLSAEEQDTYFEEYEGELERSEAGNTGVPDFIQATFGVPYALGPTFATMLANADGNRGVDEAFRDPPTTEEHLFDPASFLAGEGAEDVSAGIGEDDAEETGGFGITWWYLVLAERIDPLTALHASLGWAGDEYAIVERDGTTCVRVVFRGDTEEDEEQLAAAVDAWVGALPGGEAERIDVGGRPGIDACDPGPGVDLQLTNRSTDALVVPYLWGSIVAAHASEGPETARCVAGALLGDGSSQPTDEARAVTYERLVDPDPSSREAVSEDLRRGAVAAATRCGSGER